MRVIFLVSLLVSLHLVTPFWILLPMGRIIRAIFPLTYIWILTIFLLGFVIWFIRRIILLNYLLVLEKRFKDKNELYLCFAVSCSFFRKSICLLTLKLTILTNHYEYI